MMSLFSSFDYFFSFFPVLSDLFLVFLFFVTSYKFNLMSMILNTLSTFITSFLSSLNPASFSKNSLSLFFSLMIIVFLANTFSVFPFVFPHTSQVSMVMMMGLGFWLSFIFFYNFFNFKGFLQHSVPEGSPSVLVPLLFLIELVSNFIRPITLTVRLVANILAGHLLLVLLSQVVFSISLAFPVYFLLNSVEFFVALVQSYIFLTMVSLYYCELS